MRTALSSQPGFRRDGARLGVLFLTDDAVDGPAEPFIEFLGDEARVAVVAPVPPPTGLVELAAAYLDPAQSVSPIDAESWSAVFSPFFDAVHGPPPTLCVPGPVADLDPAPGLQPACALREQWVDDDGMTHDVEIPLCTAEDDVAETCFVYLTDAVGRTETAADDIQQACIDEGASLEVRVVRPEGQSPPSNALGSIACVPC